MRSSSGRLCTPASSIAPGFTRLSSGTSRTAEHVRLAWHAGHVGVPVEQYRRVPIFPEQVIVHVERPERSLALSMLNVVNMAWPSR